MTGKNESEEQNLEEKVIQAAKDKFEISPDDLKDFQRDSIVSVLKGKDVSIVQPPGAGKSVCFAIPTLLLNKRCLVVEPVVPLMFDQGKKLQKKGIKTEIISAIDLKEKSPDAKTVAEQLKKADIIFVSPDAIFDDKGKATVVLEVLQRMNQEEGFAVVALDEAHLCWHAFQPRYRSLLELKNLFPGTPLMALTGTATKENRQRLLKEFLRGDRSVEYWASVDVPHIEIACTPVEVSTDQSSTSKSHKSSTDLEHWKELVDLIYKEVGDEPAVLFFDNQEACEIITEAFKKYAAKLKTLAYSGDYHVEEQAKIVKSWIDGKASLVIATTALGHGVDRPDVRHVFHLGVPQSLEEWVQEAGRGGRDEKPAKATILWHEVNPADMEFKGLTAKERQLAQERVAHVLSLCKSKTCRRALLLDYFGEKQKEKECNNCDICLGVQKKTPIVVEEHATAAALDL